LSSRDLDNKDWEVVKTQLKKSYGTHINTTAAGIVFSKCYQGSKSVLDYFSEVSEVCKALIRLTPKDYVTDLTFPQNIITEAAAGAHEKLDTVNFISDANKQSLKNIGVRKWQSPPQISSWCKYSLKD
jgi:hypothetical protein